MLNNKRGATITAWAEVVLMILAIITVFGIVTGEMNSDYGVSCDPNTGVNCLPYSNESLSSFSNWAADSYNSTTESEVSFSTLGFGFNLVGAWAITKTMFLLIWDVIWGNWIPIALTSIFPGFNGIAVIGLILQILFVLGIIFAIVTLVTKVRTP